MLKTIYVASLNALVFQSVCVDSSNFECFRSDGNRF